ncbi:acetolactate synthase [Nitritalea halalkaliphila LW7]|uniref:Acetolactate synthase n=1 Tax=Nitritalea halalkaliphila LW7 TaxID=1189621 RepID=I5CAQ0_9BACT|nr:acetolactate synthase large subunit [Nitritalea halalkaliphila]EIM78902.1 acetolactate synthase [Nitritalea halalkaliphila LW7]
MKASHAFVQALENEGVTHIFAVPGEENLDLLDAIRSSSITLVLTRHEQGAGFMAATYGRLTGKAGVCMATLGPGATNLVTPIAYAQLGAMPMFVITGQKPIKKSKQARFQIIDVVDMMRPITKFTKQIVNSATIPSLVRESFRLAEQEKPGVSHLEFPEDIAQETTEPTLYYKAPYHKTQPAPAAIEQAIALIEQAEKPVVLIGAAANRACSPEVLREFIDATDIYFFTTQMGKGLIDERHPRYLGTAALSDHDFLHRALESADLVLSVGYDVVEKPPFFMKPGGKKVIHINYAPSEVDQVYFPQLDVIGAMDASLQAIAKGLTPPSSWDFSVFEEAKKKIQGHLSKYFQDTRFPMLPQRLVHLLREALDEKDIITLDNGVYKLWFARNYTCYGPNTLLLDNALASMGAGLPSAMAVNMLHPDRKVISVCGDGGFMMNSQELETAVRLKLNLTVIILNDSAYGMIKWKQEDMGFPHYGLDYQNPDFVRYAESYGARGYRPDSDEQFQSILSHCLSTDGVHVIDLPVDYSLNHPILNQLLKEQTQS